MCLFLMMKSPLPNPPHRGEGIRGSVLIEAIAAVVIMAVSLSLILQSFSANYRATVMDQDYSKALILLENRLSGILADPTHLPKIIPDEHCPLPFERFDYKMSMTKLTEPQFKGIQLLSLAVIWPAGKNGHSIDCSTFFYSSADVQTHTHVYIP